ncbi:TetR/AcrR family transcriptional regulator [Flavobacterium algicola]|uniref:TetR/AcrR family transcriptional regulator n=1 Tax=Flavobacterium algicola TaxID=556529 RepID=UPI001EFDB807|nr:TetR/AcrR family transcriptional regulator [Flavobacterium algicola]MCG9790847.1 TetR/AcrR family transcriptional regulator [Flavobacterium algicola]
MKHNDVRERIIETASFLFYKNGYNSTGINQIIAEAGIAKATLYSHFKSKEEICLSYLQFKNISFLQDFKRFTTSKPKGKEQLLAIFDFLQLFYQDKDFNGCWCIKTVSEIPKENELIRNEIQSQKNDFITVIEELISNNLESVKNEQVKSLARQIYLLYESAVGESHLHQQDWPIVESKNLCEKIIS